MISFFKLIKIIVFSSLFIASNQLMARSHIHIVGSSTVYPFTTVIAEEFSHNTDFKTPIVESTGTGGGFKLFCSGVGEKYPDFSNASRAIKPGEIERCHKNGVDQILEIKIGYDGIVLANSVESKAFISVGNNLTKEQIFLALADKIPLKGKLVTNPYHRWSDIDPALPDSKIEVYGPPTTSGTRDAFVELVMEEPCLKIKEFIDKYPDNKQRKKACHIIRTDGKFIEAGENDNLIVQKLRNNHQALGIFGFSSLQQNSNIIKGFKIDGYSPIFKNIASGKYPISRPLFIYGKAQHADLVPGFCDFIAEAVSYDSIGPDGYLLEKGLIPMSHHELDQVADKVLQSCQF